MSPVSIKAAILYPSMHWVTHQKAMIQMRMMMVIWMKRLLHQLLPEPAAVAVGRDDLLCWCRWWWDFLGGAELKYYSETLITHAQITPVM